jgi:hypothetical protein
MGEAVGNCRRDRSAYAFFVHVVRARMRNRDNSQRQSCGLCLRFEHIAPDGMHRHPVDRLVHRRQQRAHRAGMLLIEQMQRPGAVLAAAPGQQNRPITGV